MNWLKLTITSGQRVSLGQGGERAFLTTSHPVIPGSVVRGGLAAAWVAAGGNRDEEFSQVFESCRFSPAIPTGTVVVGQSVKECKYHRGTGHPERHDEAFDGRLAPDDHGCAGRNVAKGGYSATAFVTVTTTALNPRRHTAAEAQLFSRQTIERGTEFVGYVVLPDGVQDRMLRRLSTAFFGGRGSVMGRCSVKFEALSGPPRLPGSSAELVVRTISPTLLVDPSGAASTDLRDALERAGIDVVDCWAHRFDTGVAGGWHLASGLPKPTEIALAAGATALIKNPGPEKLTRLLDAGIGVRRSEGYGWLEVLPAPVFEGQSVAVTPRRDGAVEVPETASGWPATVKAFKLQPQELQWLAGRLRGTPHGHILDDDDWKEPGVGRLSRPQRDGVQRVVRDVDPGERNSLAYEITKGVRR
ncbi:CRISPR-associated protein Csx10 [Tessaracoccus bendigoensis DSM 12906]|uniref:CRISPR-associated protein Csx10 n=1 Tax=Tessaracoccus bendigoensis DSM 12906 TaxID=1123357 RepID=A0A1M6L915_9ACTN|nr:hypothetical protein [Tessaracoccus bendigoensis]SHJ67599.1 CRISPR-associated protein Csx10 [Tessaracoccus bendigoensis DSM 12906]